MAIEHTALWKEVRAILFSSAKPVHFNWKGQIVANGVTYEATKVVSIDLVRNYVDNYSDQMLVELMIPQGTYQHLIVPYRANLLFTLIGTPIGEVDTGVRTKQPMPTQQMRAVLVDTNSDVIEGNGLQSQSMDASNLVNMKRVRLQLVDATLEQVRMKMVSGIYHGGAPGDALKHVMVAALSDLKLPTDDTVVGVDMVKPDNTTVTDHVVIPTMHLLDVPDHIHNNCNGIYTTGFGFYLQNAMWYIYPPYNIKRFDEAPSTITFINVPKNRFPEAERTYRITANQTLVLVTGQTRSKDDSEQLIHNGGNGVRFLDANKVMDGFATVSDNVATAYRVKNNNEFITEKRTNGLNNAPVAKSKITSNPYREMSKLARKAGRHMQVTWENANPSLIVPGMPCKYMYTVNDQVMEAEGVVLGIHAYTYMVGKGITSTRHGCKCIVTLFIDKSLPWMQDEPNVDTKPMTSLDASTAT